MTQKSHPAMQILSRPATLNPNLQPEALNPHLELETLTLRSVCAKGLALPGPFWHDKAGEMAAGKAETRTCVFCAGCLGCRDNLGLVAGLSDLVGFLGSAEVFQWRFCMSSSGQKEAVVSLVTSLYSRFRKFSKWGHNMLQRQYITVVSGIIRRYDINNYSHLCSLPIASLTKTLCPRSMGEAFFCMVPKGAEATSHKRKVPGDSGRNLGSTGSGVIY